MLRQATDYSRKVANTNARRVQALRKVQETLEQKEARKIREAGFRRRQAGLEAGSESSLPSIDDTGMPGLDEVMQLEGQLRAQAERHAVDGSIPLDSGPNMLSVLSDHDTSRPAQTVFRKKRNESTLTSPAMTYYTIKQAASEGDLSVGGSVSHKALPLPCVSTAFLSQTAPFLAVRLRSRTRSARPTAAAPPR
eukprot:SAG22_NODE_3178_length_1873_cov_3.230552_3_plen_194_part_00